MLDIKMSRFELSPIKNLDTIKFGKNGKAILNEKAMLMGFSWHVVFK